ncbi:hypothetical protein EMIHUDRAFT_240697 [Emiliania huxleyi CCMP1516]|uniref:CWF21 domain-containing protein n=2 Tax=Emiliania huxleyi TaxID=2903 RepID=A0A0D3JEK7_EMIH1|nr:hypothetical protein EMIHUDRAFT_240697 [Emiliania huxleyi CCMP1516]EOD21942.1 hypothetical protein EMIHUDRAFT_240697 [Emiliania huxleyi CCMP1516]|eukprot:XP_005774371.1 hypothetical protein EMIHUDRAFT_240697 [Emiliania huxleyi CCMP1516]
MYVKNSGVCARVAASSAEQHTTSASGSADYARRRAARPSRRRRRRRTSVSAADVLAGVEESGPNCALPAAREGQRERRERLRVDETAKQARHTEAARHAEELLAEVEAEKRAKGKKGKKKKKGGGTGGAGPSQETEEGAEAPSEADAAEAAKKAEEERIIRLLEQCHEERIRLGITAESQAAASAEVAEAAAQRS